MMHSSKGHGIHQSEPLSCQNKLQQQRAKLVLMKNFEHTNLKVAGDGGANSIHHMSKMIMTPKYMSEVTPEIGVTLQNKHSNEEIKKEGAKGS